MIRFFSLVTLSALILLSSCLPPEEDNSEIVGHTNKLSFTRHIPNSKGYHTITVTSEVSWTTNITISQHGHCWSTSPAPTVDGGFKTELGPVLTSSFQSELTGLAAGTTYYIRAYITINGQPYYSDFTFVEQTHSVGEPVVSTYEVPDENVSDTSAVVTGEVLQKGGDDIVARGICWNVSGNPSLGDNYTVESGDLGTYTSTLTGLDRGEKYYVRAYAINETDTGYASQVYSFTTKNLPSVSAGLSSYNAISAVFNGEVSDDGGYPVTARGVYWNEAGQPLSEEKKTDNGTGTGIYTGQITGLKPETDYYIQAYAVNQAGTTYGDVISFTTPEGLPVISSGPPVQLTPNSASCGGEVDNDGGFTIIEQGVCWNTTGSPGITDSTEVYAGSPGPGSYSVTITGLKPNIIYYFRAYATNQVGTGYGGQVTITLGCPATEYGTVMHRTDYYTTVNICGQWWMAEDMHATRYTDGLNLVDGSAHGDISGDYYTRYWFAYDNDLLNLADYGLLYTWVAAMEGASGSSANPSGVQGICPAGWHVPSDAEWQQMMDNLGGADVAGDKLKDTGTDYWPAPNAGATNESGFNARPGGLRLSNGSYLFKGENAAYWTSSDNGNASDAFYYMLRYDQAGISRVFDDKANAYSVRCVKNP